MTSRTPASPARPARLLRAGLIGYVEAWELQRRLAEEVRQGAREILVLCSHPPTISLGRRATPAQLLRPRLELEAAGVRVVETDRGGGATAHNPGQIVGYPIFRLGPDPNLHGLLRGLERALVRALGSLGVVAGTRPGLTGVWVGEEKIASIGLRFARGVTMHGFALNAANDLSLFEAIVACGIEGVRVTSIARQRPVSASVEEAIVRAFEREFRLCFEEVTAAPPGALRAAGYALQ